MGRTLPGSGVRRRGSAAGAADDRALAGNGERALSDSAAYCAAEGAARCAYGRLFAYLARRSRDPSAVEDALADAFVGALERWPHDGVPQRPEAWLLTAARRRLTDAARRSAVRERLAPSLALVAQAAEERAWASLAFPDERLGMLFACAHPALEASIRAPLLLRVVLGVSADRIASAFLVSPVAMRQRLVRAKEKMRTNGMSFDVPEPAQARERLDAVLDAVYAAFGLSWDEAGSDGGPLDLTREAIFLARTIASLMPSEPEAKGLLALLLFVESRRAARFDRVGGYVPLEEQDTRLWAREPIAEAEAVLRSAGTHAIGRFQIEAAIQSAHASRVCGIDPSWPDIALLYDALVERSPALGAAIGRVAAHARAEGTAVGLQLLRSIDATRVAKYQPYWALRAHLTGDARDYERAIGLAENSAVRAFLRERMKDAANLAPV